MIISGSQMKQRLVLANSAPLHKSDLFRTAIRQLNIILSICSTCFLLSIVALILNLLKTEYQFGIPTISFWVCGNFVPIIGLTLSALHLARNVRRDNARNSTEGSSSNNISNKYSRENERKGLFSSFGRIRQNDNNKRGRNGGGYIPLSPTSTNNSTNISGRSNPFNEEEESKKSNFFRRNESGSDLDLDDPVENSTVNSKSSFVWFNFRSSFSSLRKGSGSYPRNTSPTPLARDSLFSYNNHTYISSVDIGELNSRLLMDDTSDEGEAFLSSDASDEGKFPDI